MPSYVRQTGFPVIDILHLANRQFCKQLSIDETGDLVFDYLWTKEDGWKKSSVTYPDMGPGSEFIIHEIRLDDIPDPYWSLKHCYIK